jgi:hypothetical protein
MRINIYFRLVSGIISILIGSFLLIYSSNKALSNFFFIAGILSEIYFFTLLVIKYKTKK